MAAVVRRRQEGPPTLLVVQASAGHEQEVAAQLGVAPLPVVVVHPRQVRACAPATGRLAKTAVVDAHVRAHVAQAVRPSPKPLPPDAPAQARAA
jgi:transposase